MWIINFFKKKVNKKNNNQILKLPEKFSWISTLDKNFIKLSYQDINIRIKEIQNLKKHFQKKARNQLKKYVNLNLIYVIIENFGEKISLNKIL